MYPGTQKYFVYPGVYCAAVQAGGKELSRPREHLISPGDTPPHASSFSFFPER